DQEDINQQLYGESLTTKNLLIIYETIFNRMLENYINDFDMEDIHSEIIKQIPIGCNILPPNVVILKPGNPSNCNENIYAACEMYYDDLLDKISKTGFEKICSLYKTGKLHFKQILAQNVYKTKTRVTSGYCVRNINSYTYAQLKSIKKQKSNLMVIPTQLSITQQENLTSQQISSLELSKRTCCTTTQEEKDILS
ncbi:4788_t:CDS:2, partial [Gigaspora rosea]